MVAPSPPPLSLSRPVSPSLPRPLSHPPSLAHTQHTSDPNLQPCLRRGDDGFEVEGRGGGALLATSERGTYPPRSHTRIHVSHPQPSSACSRLFPLVAPSQAAPARVTPRVAARCCEGAVEQEVGGLAAPCEYAPSRPVGGTHPLGLLGGSQDLGLSSTRVFCASQHPNSTRNRASGAEARRSRLRARGGGALPCTPECDRFCNLLHTVVCSSDLGTPHGDK